MPMRGGAAGLRLQIGSVALIGERRGAEARMEELVRRLLRTIRGRPFRRRRGNGDHGRRRQRPGSPTSCRRAPFSSGRECRRDRGSCGRARPPSMSATRRANLVTGDEARHVMRVAADIAEDQRSADLLRDEVPVRRGCAAFAVGQRRVVALDVLRPRPCGPGRCRRRGPWPSPGAPSGSRCS